MTLPHRAPRPIYTVRDVKRVLAEDVEDPEMGLDGPLRWKGDGVRETDLDGPLRRESGGDGETDFDRPLRRESGGDGETDFDGPLRQEGGGEREADFEGRPPRRRRRVVAVILPVATACVVIALALMLLRSPGGEQRPHVGSAGGASRSREANMPATNAPAGPPTPIGRVTRISRQAPALRSAPAARVGMRTAPPRSGRAIEAPQPIVLVRPVVFVDAARPAASSAPAVAEAEFGFER